MYLIVKTSKSSENRRKKITKFSGSDSQRALQVGGSFGSRQRPGQKGQKKPLKPAPTLWCWRTPSGCCRLAPVSSCDPVSQLVPPVPFFLDD